MKGPHVAINGHIDNLELNELHAAAFRDAVESVPWRDRLEQHSLFWVTARQDGHLVGFVNVIGDGGAHAILLDTCVLPLHQGRGVGRALIQAAANQASRQGCHWLHADYEADLTGFYETACGMRPTAAGLIDLRTQPTDQTQEVDHR